MMTSWSLSSISLISELEMDGDKGKQDAPGNLAQIFSEESVMSSDITHPRLHMSIF